MDDVRAEVDPEAAGELAAATSAAGPDGMWPEDLEARRALFVELNTTRLDSVDPRGEVTFDERTVPGAPGGPPVPVRIYRRRGAGGERQPGIVSIHGGGFTMGSLASDQVSATDLVLTTGAVVVSVDYRRAPEHPGTAPVEDCYAALRFLADEADALGVDATRLATFGVSAGGGLSAGVALLARDRGGPALALQVLGYPMLDDRCATPSMRDLPPYGIWDREQNLEGWAHLLGATRGGDGVSEYAAPARARDLSGLAPAFVEVGALDGLRDESIAYAARLLEAGVPVDLHVYAGAFHSVELVAPEASISEQIRQARLAAFRRAFAVKVAHG